MTVDVAGLGPRSGTHCLSLILIYAGPLPPNMWKAPVVCTYLAPVILTEFQDLGMGTLLGKAEEELGGHGRGDKIEQDIRTVFPTPMPLQAAIHWETKLVPAPDLPCREELWFSSQHPDSR